MHCPACKNALTKIIITNVQILACEYGCGGLWFSQSQVKMLENLKPGLGMPLLKIKRADGIKVYRGVEHICPIAKPHCCLGTFSARSSIPRLISAPSAEGSGSTSRVFQKHKL